MAIHEVRYGDLGQVLSTKLIAPREIEGPIIGEDGTRVRTFPPSLGISYRLGHDNPDKFLASLKSLIVAPILHEEITAINADTVIKKVWVTETIGERTTIIPLPNLSRAFKGNEINSNVLGIGRKRFVFTKNDVFVAPKRK